MAKGKMGSAIMKRKRRKYRQAKKTETE